jgi:hypothetical protein
LSYRRAKKRLRNIKKKWQWQFSLKIQFINEKSGKGHSGNQDARDYGKWYPPYDSSLREGERKRERE